MTETTSLQPLSVQFRTAVAVHMLHFYTPQNNVSMRAMLGKPANKPQHIAPLNGMDFIAYLEKVFEKPGLFKHAFQFEAEAAALVRAGFLQQMSGSPPFSSYWAVHQGATAAQAAGYLWLAPALGPEFIIRSFGAATIAITGIDNSTGEPAAGTGLLLDPRHIITNKHVVEDMTVDEQLMTSVVAEPLMSGEVMEQHAVRVLNKKSHDKIDVAVVEIEPVDRDELSGVAEGIAFRDPQWADQTWSFGYPRVPLARDPAPLVVHNGEVVNPRVADLFGNGLFLFSATARPGNSGGPIVAQDGRVIGIVTRSLEADNGPSGPAATSSPFYAGVPTSEIVTALTEIGLGTLLNVERWEDPREKPAAAT